MSKVKMLLDVVKEVKKEAPEDVPNWSKRYEEAKVNLKNQLAKGRQLPLGTEAHPLSDFAFNYSGLLNIQTVCLFHNTTLKYLKVLCLLILI